MKGISLKRVRNLPAEDVTVADLRPQQIDQLTQIPGELLDTIQDVFAGTDFTSRPEHVRALLDARREVVSAWGSARQAFLEIGRALNALDRTLLTREEREALQTGFGRIFPFSAPVASQFRRVAEMIDSGRVALEQCPGSYSAAYQLALMPPEQIAIARQRGLISQSTTRAQLMALRKELSRAAPSTVDLGALLAERRRLQEARLRGLEELRRIRTRLREINRVLEGGDPA
ncbi:hypothetical protein NON00_01960 [Roseomonas sp. GC11]|uniref:hypothetical protein n=1 Tax=Roseomonas sp. GC11 TaxID=2950546 RepID=UPI00210CF0DE|nr:hypothetical protein [Roseomonas sp. GC11]MCQ4158692.1 hypothetical protein [Roseomonas sp. GC11]